jgi:serine/threonine protein kinase/Flp pilus assembly protein TadD
MIDHDADDDRTRSHIALTQGTTVSHYRIAEKIGAGGMGEVYLAEDTKLKRQVALKFLPAHLAVDDDMRTRFTREAQAAAKLDHPNIVPVHEVSDFQSRPFIAMAHIEGKPLRDVMKKGKLSLSESVDLTMQICEGLNEAHNAGVVHRDIKPGNIIIDAKGRARILDFGLATVSGEDKLTKTGSTLGTVGYMAPEQIVGKKVDKRADLFSVGVILYEMITGRRPFTGDNDAAVVKAITDGTPEPIARFKSGVTGELQQILDKALAKDPLVRYQHADGMLADLRRPSIESASPKKSRAVLWAAAAIIIVVCGYFVSSSLRDPQQPTQANPPVLVVLPFENLGAAEGNFFSEGIADEISSRLASFNEMRVISRSSAVKYEETDKSVQEIGEELGADYVIEGTIRWDKSGDVDRIRITPKLIKTSDGYLMWADNYEQELTQIFDVQAEISEKIVTALGLTLLEPGKEAPDYAPTTNMAAYNYYLRGLDISNRSIMKTNLGDAVRMFDSAIALDPNFALAWAQKSIIHSEFKFSYATVDSRFHKDEARRTAEKALALDPNLPTGHIAMGIYYNLVGTDYEKALASFSAAKSEVTSNAALSEGVGIVLMRQGKWPEALSKLEEAVRIDPLNTRRYFYLATCYSLIRDYQSAGRYVDRALVLDPSNADAASDRVFLNLLQHGNIDGIKKSFNSITEDAGLAKLSGYGVRASSTLGLWRFIIDRIDPQEAITAIRDLVHERSPYVVYMHIAQIYDLTGKHDTAQIFYDSSRIVLNRIISQGEVEFHAYSDIGLTYALMGMADSAIAAGKKAKELMSVDDCHW